MNRRRFVQRAPCASPSKRDFSYFAKSFAVGHEIVQSSFWPSEPQCLQVWCVLIVVFSGHCVQSGACALAEKSVGRGERSWRAAAMRRRAEQKQWRTEYPAFLTCCPGTRRTSSHTTFCTLVARDGQQIHRWAASSSKEFGPFAASASRVICCWTLQEW